MIKHEFCLQIPQFRALKNNCITSSIPKYNGVEIKRILYDTRGRRSRSQDVLFRGEVIRSTYSLHVAKITATNTSMQHAAKHKTKLTKFNIATYATGARGVLQEDHPIRIFLRYGSAFLLKFMIQKNKVRVTRFYDDI